MSTPSLKEIFLCIIPIILFSGAEASAALGADERDWELPPTYLRDSGYRGEVVLNGFWASRVQTDSRAFVRTRVPDSGPGFGDEPGEKREYYREFLLPKKWVARRVVLEMGGSLRTGR